MDLLKAQLARLSQQFAALSASQRMLATTLVVIMGMTLFWWTHYAGEADMVPLLNQSFSQTDISQITARLEAKNINYTLSGDRIMVPADRNIEILADLGFAHLLPMKTDEGFDDIVSKMSPWDSIDKTNQMWLEAKDRTLSAVIEGFPGVSSATVMIDQSSQRRFDGEDVTPTAMVAIVTDSSAQDVNQRQLATAAADMVAGASAGLHRGNVAVTINGITYPVEDNQEDDGAMPADDVIAHMGEAEKHYRQQICDELGFIRGLMVSVRVDLDNKHTETDSVQYDSKNVVQKAISDQTDSNTSTGSSASAGGPPGADANTGANSSETVDSSTAAAPAGPSSDEEKETIAYQVDVPTTRTQTVEDPGDAEAVSASVRVPRSYFVDAYKDQANGQQPTDAQLDAFMTAEMARIRDEVKNCTGIASDDAVSVNWYPDNFDEFVGSAAANESASAMGVSSLLRLHGKEFGVAGLALVSLFMMMMMVRKTAPVPVPLPAAPTPQMLKPESLTIAEVTGGAQSFDAMELDEESIKTQQVVEQVSNMVTENPDGAASLVKRWLNRG
ncbi:MAG TPA: flagellar M-ring protein FliF C-terminal domain-containing protein [Tepidisphaeraceae bacterium]|nr:flagellar M-ring protein FliF C-terminal domain-containing protein [Tepidisphaeraceae bacterium]